MEGKVNFTARVKIDADGGEVVENVPTMLYDIETRPGREYVFVAE